MELGSSSCPSVILIEAVGLSASKGKLRLTYWFTNSDEGEKANQAKADSAL